MVGTAARRARESGLGGAEAEPFICEASAKLAAAVTVHGIVNSNAGEIDKGIAGYEKIAACVPGVDRVVGTLKGISRNVSGSPMSLDTIASTLALFAREVPKGGPLIGSSIDAGYKYYRESRPPLPPLPR